jgi:hypothetical protein
MQNPGSFAARPELDRGALQRMIESFELVATDQFVDDIAEMATTTPTVEQIARALYDKAIEDEVQVPPNCWESAGDIIRAIYLIDASALQALMNADGSEVA